jgi:hypothetical protein
MGSNAKQFTHCGLLRLRTEKGSLLPVKQGSRLCEILLYLGNKSIA